MAPLGKNCKIIAEIVGISFCPGRDGIDYEIVRLANDAGCTKSDIAQAPRMVAANITAWLDDIARNP